jgi:DNA polymerase III subunit epsilon
METIAVIDFETTGLSPEEGARATEIAVVLVRDGQVVDRYQSLMNAGLRVPSFIQDLTGITNAMVREAPPAARVMAQVAAFVGDCPLVAHNASFDRKFWDAELDRIGLGRADGQEFACSMLVARRLLPDAPNHKLGTLVQLLGLPVAGRYHRAQADADMAAGLTLYLEQEIARRFGLGQVPHALLAALQRAPRTKLQACVERFVARHRSCVQRG